MTLQGQCGGRDVFQIGIEVEILKGQRLKKTQQG